MPSKPPRSRARRLLLGAGVLVLVPATFGLTGFGPVDALTRQFFVPMAERAPDPDPVEWPHEVAWLEAPDGVRLEVWVFEARGAGEPAGVVLHAHGNAGNLSTHWPLAAGLTEHGFEVMAFDYRGFGRSGGAVSRRAAREDLRLALAEARRRTEGRPLFVLGQSMGAALSLEVLADPASRQGVSALAVDAPFDSWPGIAGLHLSGDSLLRRPLTFVLSALLRRAGLEPREAAARLGGLPLLVVAGTGDRICPPGMAHSVHRAAGSTARLLELPGEPHVGLRSDEARSRVLSETAAFFRDAR